MQSAVCRLQMSDTAQFVRALLWKKLKKIERNCKIFEKTIIPHLKRNVRKL